MLLLALLRTEDDSGLVLQELHDQILKFKHVDFAVAVVGIFQQVIELVVGEAEPESLEAFGQLVPVNKARSVLVCKVEELSEAVSDVLFIQRVDSKLLHNPALRPLLLCVS